MNGRLFLIPLCDHDFSFELQRALQLWVLDGGEDPSRTDWGELLWGFYISHCALLKREPNATTREYLKSRAHGVWHEPNTPLPDHDGGSGYIIVATRQTGSY